MKGRGTRKNVFSLSRNQEENPRFLLLDFLAIVIILKRFDYDEKLTTTHSSRRNTKILIDAIIDNAEKPDKIDAKTPDNIVMETKIIIGTEGMKIDRSLYPHQQFEQVIQGSKTLQKVREEGIEGLEEYIKIPGILMTANIEMPEEISTIIEKNTRQSARWSL